MTSKLKITYDSVRYLKQKLKRKILFLKQDLNYQSKINSKIKQKPNLPVVAAILDDFTAECFSHEFNLILIRKNKWEKDLKKHNISFLFCESAWNGNFGQWRGAFNRQDTNSHHELKKLINYCKENKIKTVFWNKEDPPNFNSFIISAPLFDFIFTTDKGSVERYKEKSPQSIVNVLLFAAQPSIHNPLNRNVTNDICFAGSWGESKYPERSKQLGLILNQAIKQFNLSIYDRNFHHEYEHLKFPKAFHPYVKEPVSYQEISRLYKNFKAIINVDSVQNSTTMFSRRVFEVLASYTPVVSSHSIASKNIFGDLIYFGESENDFSNIFNSLKNLDQRKSHLAYRQVMVKHTYSHRAQEILETTHLKFLRKTDESLNIVCFLKDDFNFHQIIENFNSISYPKKCFFVSLGNQNLNMENTEICKINNISILDHKETETLLKNNNQLTLTFPSNSILGSNLVDDLLLGEKFSSNEDFCKFSFYLFNSKNHSLYLINQDQDFKTLKNRNEILANKNIPVLLRGNKNSKRNFNSLDRYNFLLLSNHDDYNSTFIKKCNIEEAKEISFI